MPLSAGFVLAPSTSPSFDIVGSVVGIVVLVLGLVVFALRQPIRRGFALAWRHGVARHVFRFRNRRTGRTLQVQLQRDIELLQQQLSQFERELPPSREGSRYSELDQYRESVDHLAEELRDASRRGAL
jgi:hypothetical protein